jgi:isopentenyl diphosphate isomerase/L-lactate dehydrogenase-like FMN-dependent dehydrogenase
MFNPQNSPGISPGPEVQADVYKDGLAGKPPRHPVSIDDLERAAQAQLKAEAFDYVARGSGAEETLRANRSAFGHWKIVPRYLQDVAERDLGVSVLGKTFSVPFLLAPIGVQSILHKHAELAVARAARAFGVPLILSTASSNTMEDVANDLQDTPRWFQLYWPKNDALAASLLKRAEAAGYSAVVVTVDTNLLGWRERDIKNAYLPFLHGDGLANYFTDPVFHEAIGGNPKAHPIKAIEYFLQVFSDPAHTWKDLEKLRSVTRLPIILKGILHPDDAKMALDHGVSGIIVSNHGGRQLDGAIATLDALPAVAEAVAGKIPVIFDSGIRQGADVFKAMALGASCVLLGRPYAYGLAIDGEDGVASVLRNLIADIDLTLGLAGCRSFTEVNRGCLVSANSDGKSGRANS